MNNNKGWLYAQAKAAGTFFKGCDGGTEQERPLESENDTWLSKMARVTRLPSLMRAMCEVLVRRQGSYVEED